MDFEIEIMTQAERSYCYTGSQQLDKQTGCIGHLRGDMDRSGKGFFTSWEDHCGELKTQAFKDEFDDFINALRFDERYDGIFKNRSSLSRYCYEHKESVFAEDFIPQYGFRVDTPEYAYLLRLNPMQGDYNLYIYCYRREALDRHLKNAERGICFVNPQGKTLFHIPDGDSIRVIRPDGTHAGISTTTGPKSAAGICMAWRSLPSRWSRRAAPSCRFARHSRSSATHSCWIPEMW